MKLRLKKGNGCVIAALAMIAVSFGGSSLASAKSANTSLDDIQLDDQPAPVKKTRPALQGAATSKATHSKKKAGRKTASVDDIELDGDKASEKKAAEANPVAAEKIPDQILLLLAAATIHEKDHDYKSVIATLKPKLDQLPRSGLLQLARAYAQEKMTADELHTIQLVVAKNPKDYVAQAALGQAYLKMNRTDDAATAFSASREINAKYRPAYEGALAILEKSQDSYEARALVADIIRIFGADAKTTAELCKMYSGEAFVPEKTEDACRNAIAKDPKNPENYVFLTQALTNTGQKDQADSTIADAAKRFPASENVQNLAGSMKIDDKSFADSYRFFENSVKAAPNSPRAWLGLAKSAFELQKHDEAIEDFVKACKLDRKTTLDFRQAATTLKRSKDTKWLKYQDAVDERCD